MTFLAIMAWVFLGQLALIPFWGILIVVGVIADTIFSNS
jgi:hypothetical protein